MYEVIGSKLICLFQARMQGLTDRGINCLLRNEKTSVTVQIGNLTKVVPTQRKAKYK